MQNTVFKRKAKEIEEGEGVLVNRLFPLYGFMNYDPFVLIDEFNLETTLGFPTHPHRGFEAISYIIKGSLRHQDNMGNDTTVTDGGVQMFTAGSGMTHSEMPVGKQRLHGFQLWVNLAQSQKHIAPYYRQVDAHEFPIQQENGIWIKTLVGEGSPLKLNTPIEYQDIQLEGEKQLDFTAQKGFSTFIYLMEGKLAIGDEILQSKEALFLENSKNFSVKSQTNSRFIYLSGQPHREPIKQHGPYVD